MARLVFVGLATYDVIALVPRYPGPDERIRAAAVVHAAGGPSATAAVTAARLGASAAFVGPIAADEQGESILAALVGAGVDVAAVSRVPAGAGGSSLIVVQTDAPTRAICTTEAPAYAVEPGGPAAALLRAAEWVHVDDIGWAAIGWLRAERPARPLISVDGGNADIPGLVPAEIDLYAPTTEALRARYGPLPAEHLLRAAVAAGYRTVVATRGADGALAIDPAGRSFTSAGLSTEVVSTLGAGDVFHGALLAELDRTADLPAAVAYANAAAALSCRALDGQSAIPSDPELRAFVAAQEQPYS